MGKVLKAIMIVVVLVALFGSHDDNKTFEPATTTVATAATATATPAVDRHRRHHHRRRAAARAATATPQPAPTASGLMPCDANIRARVGTTTCPFAENVFYEYFRATYGIASATTVHAWSPAAGRSYTVRCTSRVVCTAGDGAEVRFAADAVASYDEDQAAAYAGSHDVGPDDSASDDADLGSDDGDEDPGSGDGVHPPLDERIANYDEGNGYPVQCADGMWSKSGGLQGACSGHGGVG